MTYVTYGTVKPGVTRERLEELVEALAAFECSVRYQSVGRILTVELPGDAYQWIVTGGFATLQEAYRDCLEWHARLDERLPGRRTRALPRSPAARHLAAGG